MVKTQYLYNATVTRVVDGDTVDVDLDLGFEVHFNCRLRLYGINTEELTSRDPVLREQANVAKQRLEQLIAGKHVTLETFKTDKYGRYLANVYLAGVNINQQLVTEGLAKVFMV